MRTSGGAASLEYGLEPGLAAALRAADVPDETLYLTSEVLRWTPELPAEARRAWTLLVIASLENQRNGSTRLPLPPPSGLDTPPSLPLLSLLQGLGVGAPERDAVVALTARLASTPSLSALVGGPADYKPFIVDGHHLYHQRTLRLEQRLAESLAGRLRRKEDKLAGAELDRAMAAATSGQRPLTADQRAAIRAILVRPLTVISGGPGTGKTSIIVAALRALKVLGVSGEDVALAAPTGKAANRIANSLAAEKDGAATVVPAPQTIHRLLGYRAGAGAGAFRHHENYRLPHKVVIVDESSMVDLDLMERLARATRDDAKLVLLGDANQLPSVEAGAVFRDLGTLAVTLTENHRMNPALPEGRAILTAAETVLRGRPDELAPTIRARASEVTFEGVELLLTEADAVLHSFLERWQRERMASPSQRESLLHKIYAFSDGQPAPADLPELETLFGLEQRHRILCVTRSASRPTGAEAVNATLHRAGRAGASRPSTPATAEATQPFAPGQPLIMLRNDYGRGLFNGDQGLCLKVARSSGGVLTAPFLAAVFPQRQGFVAFPLESLQGDLGLAYALTVHRAQGSETDHLALILPDDDLPLLSRELLYTAITRARRSVVIVGCRPILEQGIRRRIERYCGLAERL